MPTGVTGGEVARQDRTASGRDWGGGSQVFRGVPAPCETPTQIRHFLVAQSRPPQAGRYRVLLNFTQAPDYGNAELLLSVWDRPGVLSGYPREVRWRRVSLGEVSIGETGVHLTVTVTGLDRASTSYLIGLDRMELVPE